MGVKLRPLAHRAQRDVDCRLVRIAGDAIYLLPLGTTRDEIRVDILWRIKADKTLRSIGVSPQRLAAVIGYVADRLRA